MGWGRPEMVLWLMDEERPFVDEMEPMTVVSPLCSPGTMVGGIAYYMRVSKIVMKVGEGEGTYRWKTLYEWIKIFIKDT